MNIPVRIATDIKDRYAYEACPLCGSTKATAIGTADCSKHPLYHPDLNPLMNWVACNGCGHEFTEGYFTEEAAALVATRTSDKQKAGNNLEGTRAVSAEMVENVRRHVQGGRWLDIGFGNGALLMAAGEFGFHPIGLDLRADNVERLKSFGIEAHCKDLDDLEFEEKCNVISMMDVVEHVPFPKPFLKSAIAHLAPGGICMVSVPNRESVFWQEQTKAGTNPYYAQFEHCHNFNRSDLEGLLVDLGLELAGLHLSKRYRLGIEILARKPD